MSRPAQPVQRSHRKFKAALCENLEVRRLLALTAPVFNSLPGAPVNFYLDFTGSPAFTWDNNQQVYGPAGPGTPIPAFDWDGDPTTFSASDTAAMKQICQFVAEKFSPFQVNVTTTDPGNRNDRQTEECIVSGSPLDWFQPGATNPNGGVSQVGSFTNPDLQNVCFVFANAFPNQLNYVATNVAHELGHTLGLVHEQAPGTQYYSGDANQTPIMGNAANNPAARGIWWKTNAFPGQNSTQPIQDELAIMAGSTPDYLAPLSYRTDDYGDGVVDQTDFGTLSVNSANAFNEATGVITFTTDVDEWRFTATNEHVKITVSNAQYGGMLAPAFSLYEAGTNHLIFESSGNTSATLDVAGLVPGTSYSLRIGSKGGYGAIGQYRIDGQMQAFATLSGGVLTVSGATGNNNLTITLELNDSAIAIVDQINGNNIDQAYDITQVNQIDVQLGDGNDNVIIDTLRTSDVPTQLPVIPVFVNGGAGQDTLTATDGEQATYTLDGTAKTINWTSREGGQNQLSYEDVEQFSVQGADGDTVNGVYGDDVLNVLSFPPGPHLTFNGGAGNDKMYVSASAIATGTASMDFFGGAGTDTLTVDGSAGIDTHDGSTGFIALTVDQDTDTTWHVQYNNGFLVPNIDFDTAVEGVSLIGAAGDDEFQVQRLPAGTSVTCNGGAGDDSLDFGTPPIDSPDGFDPGLPFSDTTLGNVFFQGGTGSNSINIDDRGHAAANTYTITTNTLKSTTSGIVSWSIGVQNVSLSGAESSPSTFNANGGNLGSSFLALAGGSANDIFNIDFSQRNDVSVDGGGGVDALTIDDRNGPFAFDHVDQFADHVDRVAAGVDYRIDFASIESPEYLAFAQTHKFNIYSVSAPSGDQLTVVMGSGDDTVTIFPNTADAPVAGIRPLDDSGDLTINGNVGIDGGGGNDSVVVDDTASSEPIDYTFANPFGSGTQDISGMGTGLVGVAKADVENLIVMAGAGDDAFEVNQYTSGVPVSILGGDGNDTVNFGNNDIAAQLTNLPTFSFDGGDGSNTFDVNNSNNTTGWSYMVSTTTGLKASELFPGNYVGGSWLVSNLSVMSINAGPGNDTFAPSSLPAGEQLILDGGDGNDQVNLNANNTNIMGLIDFLGEAGTNSIVQLTGPAAPVTVHLLNNSIGAVPGDTFFGPGGALELDSSVTSIFLTLSQGADTIYVQPSPSAAITLRDGSGGADGDTLNLALAYAQNYVLNGTASSGSVTSDNLKTLSYSGFENGPIVDDVAPFVIDRAFNDDLAPNLLTFHFSEDVSASLNALLASNFSVINADTGDPVPASFVSYDPAGNTATYSFAPASDNGALPDGNYLATVPDATTYDLAGNTLIADANSTLSFFHLTGDANHDRTVDTADFVIMATNFGQTGATFSQGDFNYDGVVNALDFNALATQFGTHLAPPAAQAVQSVIEKPQVAGASLANLFADRPIVMESLLD